MTQQFPPCSFLQVAMAELSARFFVGYPHELPQACPSGFAPGFVVANALCLEADSHFLNSFLQFLFQGCTPWERAGALDASIAGMTRARIKTILEECDSQFVFFIGQPLQELSWHTDKT